MLNKLYLNIQGRSDGYFVDRPGSLLVNCKLMLNFVLFVGVTCPVCDENVNCSWDKYCFPGQVCMIGLTPIISHCSEVQ